MIVYKLYCKLFGSYIKSIDIKKVKMYSKIIKDMHDHFKFYS